MVTLNDGEEVVLEAHRHWIVLLPAFLTLGLLALAPLFAYGVLDALPIVLAAPGWGPALLGFAYSGFLLALWIGGYLVWLDHALDIWILTNERLIDVEQKGLFRREVSSLRLENIEDMTAEVDGALATYLNFGDVAVQTASEAAEFSIRNLAEPQALVDAINAQLAKRDRASARAGA